jgi:hypothetical protein
MRPAWALCALLAAGCGGPRDAAESLEPDPAGDALTPAAAAPAEPYAGLPESTRALCSEMAHLAHEAYGGRPAFMRGSARLQVRNHPRGYPACTVTVEVEHFERTGGAPADILERVRRDGWRWRDGGGRLPAGEIAFALERGIDLCFVRWLSESHPDWRAERTAVVFSCAVTDWDDVRARDPD